MKRGLLILLVLSFFVLTACSSNEVSFTDEELEEMYDALEETDTGEEAIQYAPSDDSKSEVFNRLRGIVSDKTVEECEEMLRLEGYVVSIEEEEEEKEEEKESEEEDDYESAASS